MTGGTLRTSRLITTLSLLLLLSPVACSRDREQAAPPAVAQPASNVTFAQDSLREWFIENALTNVPGSEQEILGTIGEPDSVVRLPSANAQDPMAFDTIIEVYYPGLRVGILKIMDTESVQSVWVADTTFLIGPIRIGTDSATVTRLLGPTMASSRLGYACRTCSVLNQTAAFELIDGRVSAIVFNYPGS